MAKQGPKPQAQHHNNNSAESEGSRKQQKKKGKMQKIDASAILGFTVHAGERVNMGEIDSVDGWENAVSPKYRTSFWQIQSRH